MGYMTSCFSVGVLIGPALGGYLSVRAALWTCMAFTLATLIFVAACVPECAPGPAARAAARRAAAATAKAAASTSLSDKVVRAGNGSRWFVRVPSARAWNASAFRGVKVEASGDESVAAAAAAAAGSRRADEERAPLAAAAAAEAAEAAAEVAAAEAESLVAGQTHSVGATPPLAPPPGPAAVPHGDIAPAAAAAGAPKDGSAAAGAGCSAACGSGEGAAGTDTDGEALTKGRDSGSGGLMAGWLVIKNSSFYRRIALIWVVVSMTWEGAGELLFQYLQLKLGYGTRDQVGGVGVRNGCRVAVGGADAGTGRRARRCTSSCKCNAKTGALVGFGMEAVLRVRTG